MAKREIIVTVVILSIMIGVVMPYQVLDNEIVMCGRVLPSNAKLYYDSYGRLWGAVVPSSDTGGLIKPKNPFKAESNLPKVLVERNGPNVIVTFHNDGAIVDRFEISMDEIATFVGSMELAEELVDRSLNYEEPVTAPARMNEEPIESPDLQPIGTPGNLIGHWKLDDTQSITEVPTKVGVMYSGYHLESILHLKMEAGSKVTSSVSGGPFSYGRTILFDECSVTHFLINTYGINREITYLFDYTYEHWTFLYLHVIPFSTVEYWFPSHFRSLSGEFGAYIASTLRTKDVPDDTLIMQGDDWKEKRYSDIDQKDFGFDLGADWKGRWFGDAVEMTVPIASVSILGSMWTSSEVVYEFHNPTSFRHTWNVYEWDSLYSYGKGWVLSFTYTS